MARLYSKWISLSCLSLICLGNPYAYSQMNADQVMPIKQFTMQNRALKQNLHILLNKHGRLLNQAILAALYHAPSNTVEAVKARLFRNSSNIANLLASLYGPQAGKTFQNLFNQHILDGAQYINAIQTNNQRLANQIAKQAISNGRALAEFFSRLNPSVPYTTWQTMFDDHVMLEAQQTNAYFQENLVKANQLRDASLAQLRELANLIAYSFLRKPADQMHIMGR
jgi:hypothetical protein